VTPRGQERAGVAYGLAAETVMLLPAALGYLLYLGATGRLVFGHADRVTDVLLVAAGLVTALPLMWFANAARRLRYATVGLLQYLAPTGQFVLAVAIYGEPFTRAHLVSFAFIWGGLALYSFDAIRSVPRARPRVAAG
jgi:chloramphenicol-sensitive protein RarD